MSAVTPVEIFHLQLYRAGIICVHKLLDAMDIKGYEQDPYCIKCDMTVEEILRLGLEGVPILDKEQ